jgi:unsaturated rhamnogalacturonyl hydrolase
MTKTQLDVVSSNVIQRLLETWNDPQANDHFAIDKWEWPQGVALYALFLQQKERPNAEISRFLIQWFQTKLAGPAPVKNVNTTAPLLTLAFLAEQEGNPGWRRYCEDWARWVYEEMPRTEEGGLQHITSHLVNEGELWADTLFMTVLFLAKMGVWTGRQEWVDEAEAQYLLHIHHLEDGASGGLWYHGWTYNGRHHFGNVHWARGNSWFTAGAVELLEITRSKGAVRRRIADALVTQAKALVKVQDPHGLWHTILDNPASYTETSGTAAIAYGLLKGARLGLLGPWADEAGRKAAEAVLTQIGADGVVKGVSYGTAVGNDEAHYLAIPVTSTAYGQGLTYWMLGEYRRRLGE